MPPLVHPTAVISAEATLAPDVRVGPLAVIDGPVSVGPGCVVEARAHLIGPLTLGPDNRVGGGSVLGGDPQHLGYKGEPTQVVIGRGNVFRENCTVNRGMPVGAGRGYTRVGDHNFLMAGSHVGHDVILGSHCVMANGALLGGHAEIADRVFISGNSAVHQFCRVGRLAMVAGVSASTKDMPPFWVVQNVNRVVGINVVGMKRAGIPAAEITAVRKAFRMIYLEQMLVSDAVRRMEAELGHVPAVLEVAAFIRSSARGVCGPAHYDRPAAAA